MQKRALILETYDTAAHDWTLSALKLSDAVQKTKFYEKPVGDGAWDFSTYLTDGVPKFQNRTLTATLEKSSGNRLSREADIRELFIQLHGRRVDIELPDDPEHYLTGRLHLAKDRNNLAHAIVKITATCDPWKYSKTETVRKVTATTEKRAFTLANYGGRAVVPVITVEGEVLLEYGAASLALGTGTHSWTNLLLTPGAHEITISGTGTVTFTYREAVIE